MKMKAYVCSIGEPTTEICCDQLRKFDFDVVLLDEKEPWITKYKKFINLALEDEPCLRIDADVIVNHLCDAESVEEHLASYYMLQYKIFDFYRNGLSTGQPVAYSPEGLQIISENLDKLNPLRPETSAWRLPEINHRTFTKTAMVVGSHGIGCDMEHLERAKKNKINRKQISTFDFPLAQRILELYHKDADNRYMKR